MKEPVSFRYRVVDVFTKEPLEGNPLAVFPDASGIHEELQQKIATAKKSGHKNVLVRVEREGNSRFVALPLETG